MILPSYLPLIIPPVANAGQNQIVNENATVALVGAGIDSDPKDVLNYLWRQIGGPAVRLSNTSSSNPTFAAPMVPSDTDLQFSLTASDDKGASSSPAIVTVTIKHINRSPMANAGKDQTVNGGYIVSLDGTGSEDPDNEPITYKWKQTEGPLVKLDSIDTSIATFTAPSDISADTTLAFILTVTDDKDATGTDDAKVIVKYVPLPNTPPVANAGVNQTVNAGDIATLDGSKSTDPDNDPLNYSWIQTGGPPVTLNGADTATPSFTTPTDITTNTDLTFKLTVIDDKNAASTAAVKVTIIYVPPPSQASVANAGEDQVVDLPDEVTDGYQFVRKWGSKGSHDGQFESISGIAVDSLDNVYVADGKIQKFDSDGNFVTKWGSVGTGDGQFIDPIGIAVDSSGYVYVTDRRNDRIQKFDSDGNFITKWGSEGTGNGQFQSPSSIAVDSSGNVYVPEWGNDRVQKFDSDGNFITKWGSEGTGNGQFSNPRGVAVDSSDYVYVGDHHNDRIQVFAPGLYLIPPS